LLFFHDSTGSVWIVCYFEKPVALLTLGLVIITTEPGFANDFRVINLRFLPFFSAQPQIMPVNHYENFPVASILLPANLRPAVEAIYAFARSADDLADEGDAIAPQRLVQLGQYEQALDAIAARQAGIGSAASATANPTTPTSPTSPFTAAQETERAIFARLEGVIKQYSLPLQPFYDLLSAFKQDVETTRYATFALLLDYCRRSANPVGALMLALYQANDAQNLHDSDAICSALQLINFWQDVEIDWRKQRIYLPLEDLAGFGVTEQDLATQQSHASFQALMQFEVNRARQMMIDASGLALRLPGRIGWELRLVVQGGLRILQRIEMANYDIFTQRPKLQWRDWLLIFWRALWMKPGQARQKV
jgi:squalene synthase HpnC